MKRILGLLMALVLLTPLFGDRMKEIKGKVPTKTPGVYLRVPIIGGSVIVLRGMVEIPAKIGGFYEKK